MHISLAAAATAAAAADAVLLCSTLYRIIRTLCILMYNTNYTEILGPSGNILPGIVYFFFSFQKCASEN